LILGKDGETHWIKQATGLREEKKKKKILETKEANTVQII
jgi:hypothetical protein